MTHTDPGSVLSASRDPFTDRRALVLFTVLWALYAATASPVFDDIIPDNIAQTAYWNLLTQPELIGAIGSSSPKAGLIIMLGALHTVTVQWLQLEWLFSAALALLAAAICFLTAKIAHQIGGIGAGLAALAVTLGSGHLFSTWMLASSNLFFLPPVLAGLWLLGADRERAGILMLCLAVTVRPEAIVIVAAVIATRTLATRRWRRAVEYSIWAVVAIALFAFVALWVQGSWQRSMAGAATGYPAFASLRTLEHLREVFGQLFANSTVALLFVPTAVAIWKQPRARVPALFFVMPVFIIGCVVAGIFGMHFRYIAAAEYLVIALGCGGLALFLGAQTTPVFTPRDRITLLVFALCSVTLIGWLTQSVVPALLTLAAPSLYLLAIAVERERGGHRAPRVIVLVFAALLAVNNAASGALSFNKLRSMLATPHPAIADAREFLANASLPAAVRVISEDELLNYVIATQPSRLRAALSLQAFNLLDEAQRIETLSQFDYLYFSKRTNYGWNYFFYFPRPEWQADPFRRAIVGAIGNSDAIRYGPLILQPIEDTATRFVLRIDKGH